MNKAWRERLLRYCIGGIELLVLSSLLSLINFKATGGALSVAGIVVMYIISFIINRIVYNRKFRPFISFVLNVSLWIVVFQIIIKLQIFAGADLTDPAFLFAVPRGLTSYTSGFRHELIIFFTSIPLWLLGYRLGRMRIGFGVSLAEFQTGLAIILFTYFINAQIGASSLNSTLVPLVYIALAIFALTISHAEQASSWLSSRHASYWFALLIISIIVIVAVGFLAGMFTNHDVLDLLFTPVRWAWWLFSQFMLFLAEHTVMERYLNPLDWSSSGGSQPGDQDEVFRMFQMPLWLRDGLRFILFVAWFAFIVLALWRLSSFLIQWLRSHFVGRTQAEVESLNGAFKDDILNLLRRIWHSITHLFYGDRGEPAAPEIQSVRQIYREVLSWGTVKGVRRPSDATPYEYLSALSEALPLAAADLRFITDRYVSVRYGSMIPGVDEIGELKTTWQRLKRNGNSHK